MENKNYSNTPAAYEAPVYDDFVLPCNAVVQTSQVESYSKIDGGAWDQDE